MLKTSGTQPSGTATLLSTLLVPQQLRPAMAPAEPGLVVDPADDYNTLATSTAGERKFKQCHARAFAYIRRLQSPPIFEKTLGHKTSVLKLLRMLKNCWSDNTTQDRDRMRTEFDSMRLSDFSDMDAFITSYNNHVRVHA